MFSGIVVETGEVLELREDTGGLTIRTQCQVIRPQLEVGQSVSVDGVCLTVTGLGPDWFEAHAVQETLRRSTLGRLKPGSRVNLEPPLRASDFLGGHLVQGHVDGVGTVSSITRDGSSKVFRFRVPPEVRRYCVMKGSVAINGVSLTLSGLDPEWIEVAIIPHTLAVTNFSNLRPQDEVNLEADVISKYVESHIQHYLAESGSLAPALGSDQ